MKNIEKIFENTSCISTDMLKTYIKDELTQAEKHQVEKHIVQCDMCSDVLEGLAEMKNQKKLLFYTEKINKKVNARIKPKQRRGVLRIKPVLSIAAALIVLFGIGYFIKTAIFDISNDSVVAEQMIEKVKNTPESKLQNKTKITESVKDEKENELNIANENKSKINTGKKTEKTNRAKEYRNSMKNNKIAEDEFPTPDTETVEYSAESVLIDDEELDEDKIAVTVNSKKDNDDAYNPDFELSEVHDNIKATAVAPENEEKAEDDASEGKSFLGATRSHRNMPSIEEIKKTDKSSKLSKTYELAVKLYNEKKFTLALQKFNMLIKANADHKYDALWYKALIYKSQGKTEEARKLFRKVFESKSSFSKKAKNELLK